MGPWNTDQINQARCAPFSAVLNFSGVYYKRDKKYGALNTSRKSIRIQVGYQGWGFLFILPGDYPNQSGGGAIDFVRHLAGQGCVHGLDAAEELGSQ